MSAPPGLLACVASCVCLHPCKHRFLYLGPTKQLCLKVNTKTKDEGPTHHCQPGHQPQALGQTNPPLLGERNFQQHGSLLCTGQHREKRKKKERGSWMEQSKSILVKTEAIQRWPTAFMETNPREFRRRWTQCCWIGQWSVQAWSFD